MRVKNTTPFLAGYKVTSRRPPRPEVTIIVRAAYVLAPGEPLRLPEGQLPASQGSLRAEVYREDDEARTGGPVYPGDFADFKLRAEVMLRGACHPPGGRAVKDCAARFAVGAWSKSLHVVGRRVWSGDAIREPAPFTEMPLGYENAFGGPGWASNPAGKGLATAELPNVELPGERVRSRADRPAPAGFGPRNPGWPERAGKLGTQYGAAWRRERAPFFAADFSFSYFSAAPDDQQIEGYLRGDEEVSFQNLHPRASRFSVRLPGRRVRAFVNDVRGRFREATMALDTLFADLEEGRLYLTWRGVEPVEEDDLADVRTVLVADEALDGPREAEASYRERLLAFERDPVGLDEAAPPHLRASWAAMRRAPGAGAPRAAAGAPTDEVGALLGDRMAHLPASEQARVRSTIEAALALPAPPGVDLRAELARALNDPPSAPFALPASPGAPLRAPIGGTLQRALAQAGAVKATAAAAGKPAPGLDGLDAVARDPRLRAIDPGFRPGEPPLPPPEPGPGMDLSGQDLRGRDLRGVDLSGANLSDALLSGAKLARARLAGATLARAVLAEADLAEADLSGADLTLANLSRARAVGADLRRARLDQLNAGKAVLADALLDEATGEAAIFAEADLGRARLRGVRLTQAVFDGASLEGADLSAAELLRCRFLGARAAGARFERATLDGTCFTDADLAEAVFVEAKGDATIWIRAALTRADLRRSVLPRAQMIEARATSARMRGADLREARFYRARLDRADLAQANLMSADLCKAVLAGASFAGASLYDAKLLGASGEGCDLSGANLRRAIPERA